MEKKENARVEESLNLEMLLLCVELELIEVVEEFRLNDHESKRFMRYTTSGMIYNDNSKNEGGMT